MIWTAYIDETDTHGAPVMAIGGFLAPAKVWKEFDKDWTALLDANGLEYSHAQDLVTRKGHYKGWGNEQHNAFVAGAREIINRHLKGGFVSVMRLDDYNDHYKLLPKPRKVPEDTPYGVCFRACISFSLAFVIHKRHGKTRAQTVNFIIENGGVKAGYARQIYGRFKKNRLSDKEFVRMLGPVIGFAEKKESAGCQAADLWLMGVIRRERTEHGTEYSDISRSSLADETQPIDVRDVPTFRIPTTPEILLSLRENMFVDEALRRAWAESLLGR